MPRTGIVLYHGIDSGEQVRDFGRAAEEAGLDSLWVTERYFHEETFSLLGYLGAVTSRLKLGVGVVNPFTRNPALLAMAAATIDRITGGRFLLGLGRSDSWVIGEKMGMPYEKPLETLAQTVAVLRELLSGQRVSQRGNTFHLSDVRAGILPAQDRVPVYLAAIGPRALRLAGTVADGVLLNAYVPPAYVRYAVGEIERAAKAAGRSAGAIDIACMMPVRLTDDPSPILPDLKKRIVRLLAEPHIGEVLLDKGGFDSAILGPLREAAERGSPAATSLISDEMVHAFYVVGGEQRCREQIAAYREAGVDLPLLLPLLEDYYRVAECLSA